MALDRHPLPRDPQVARAIDSAVGDERERVHAWLHDSVLQVLELIAAGGYVDEPDPELLSRLAAGAADELRTVIEGHVRATSPSLTGEIMRAVQRERTRSRLAVRLEVGEIDDSAAEAPRELCDAIAEALHNAAKHSGATVVTIRYELIAGVATVIISDVGVGFDVGQTRERRGMGLSQSIVGRLRRAGGWATIDSRPGGGTRIVLRLRLSQPGGDVTAIAAGRR